MNNKSKYLLLYFIFVISVVWLFYSVNRITQDRLDVQNSILLKQAQTHFKDQVNTREWNSKYGGVYVIPRDGEKPNPYLKNNILKVNDNLTLIKINPAWMTRQLSQQLKSKNFHFQITSLLPINPNNIATPFQERALKYFEKTNKLYYYELNDTEFNYMGALITEKSCLQCHKEQGYKLGDIRGGISVSLDTNNYRHLKDGIKNEALTTKVLALLFLISIVFLIHKQIKNNQKLEEEVLNRTHEINTTKKLLYKVLDNDQSFLLLSDGAEIIFANKPLLDFAGLSTLEELENKDHHISDKFETVNDPEFIRPTHNGIHWIDYIQQEYKNKKLKVLVKQNGKEHYFSINAKKIDVEEKILYLIMFDEITESYKRIESLKEEASTDALTGLLNRRKIDDILCKEVDLSNDLDSELCVIFLDIDHFKNVNDTYGHDVGDEILKELADVIKTTTRKNDYIARWGGEEFMIVLRSINLKQAQTLAEKLRLAVEKYKFYSDLRITISLGATKYLANENKEIFTKRADEALYEAKNSGRNRVIVK